MGLPPDTELETVTVPLKVLRAIEAELVTMLSQLDGFVRLRPSVARTIRLLKELDPDMTPVRPSSENALDAYLASTEPAPPPSSSLPESIRSGPRFSKKDDLK